MTTAQMIVKVRRLLSYDLDLTPSLDGDNQPIDTTDADIVQSLNDAQIRLGTLCPIFDPSVPLTLTSASHYDLSSSSVCSRKVQKALDVVIGGNMLYTALGSKPGPWSLSEIEKEYSKWRTDDAGIPLRWAHTSDSTIVLHPKPNADTISGGNNFVSAHVLPADLDSASPTGVSELPVPLHEHVVRLAAALEAESVIKTGDQFQKVETWKNAALQTAAKMGSDDRSAKSPLGTTSGRSRPNFVRMR